ncbi:MAG: tyrosine recombinase XerC [bacterium]|nr:tyrosine recombinase XerC [bacterium]
MALMNDHISRFLEYLDSEKVYSGLTRKSYNEDLMQFSRFLQKRPGELIREIGNIDHLVIREFLSDLVKQEYSKKSILRKLAAIKSFFKFLYMRRMVERNPADLVSSPKLEKKLPHFLYLDELNEMLDFVREEDFESVRNKAVIEVLFSTGVRVSELVGMDLADIDQDSSLVKVRGKGNKERLVVLGSSSLQALKKYIPLRNHLLKALNRKEEALVINQKGSRLTDRGVRYVLQTIVKETALARKVSPHTIRHTFATYMINNGCDIRVVQEMLGHVSLSTTQIYTHIMKNKLKDVYEKCHPHA